MGLMPQGSEMVKVLSNMYTETLGHWSLYLFLVGAFAVFYSTLFASTAAHCRMVPDFLAMLGVFDKNNYALRLRYTRIFAVVLLFVPAVYFMFLQAPVLMVKIGGGGPGAHAARHRVRHRLATLPPHAQADPPERLAHVGALAVRGGHGRHDRLLGPHADRPLTRISAPPDGPRAQIAAWGDIQPRVRILDVSRREETP